MASCLIVLTLACACSAAEPMEASFCDMWPLAVGNQWVLQSTTFAGGWDTWTIVAEETHNGYAVWRTLIAHQTKSDDYVFFVLVDGWYHILFSEADLDVIPDVANAWSLVLPETFQEGATFPAGAGADYQLPSLKVVFEHADVVDLVTAGSEQDVLWRFTRSQGPAILAGEYSIRSVIAGTCSGLYETHISGLPWTEVGQLLRLSVPGYAGTGFQWYKDDMTIEGATGNVYLKSPADFDDSGSYTCRVSDQTKSFHDTPPAEVTVFAEGILPAFGAVGIGAAVLGCLVLGVRGILRRKSLNVGVVR